MTQLTEWLAAHVGHRRLLVPDYASVKWLSHQLLQQGVPTLGLRLEVEADVRLSAADPFPAHLPESARLQAVTDALKNLPDSPWAHVVEHDRELRRQVSNTCLHVWAAPTMVQPTMPRDRELLRLADAVKRLAPAQPAGAHRVPPDDAPILTLRWLRELQGPVSEARPRPAGATNPVQRLQCANPETEAAVISRMILERRKNATVFCDARDIGRWVARFRAHGAPVRALLPLASAGGRAEKWLAALLAVVTQPRISLDDLQGALLSTIAWDPDVTDEWAGNVRNLIRGLRRRGGSLQQWRQRISALAKWQIRQGESRAQRHAEPEELQQWERTKAGIGEAEAWLTERLQQLALVGTPAALLSWIGEHRKRKFASAEEGLFSRIFTERLGALPDATLQPADMRVLDDVRAQIGYSAEWIDEIPATPDGPVVDVVPWGTLYDRTGRELWLTGLDAWPPAPSSMTLLTQEFEKSSGIHDATAEFRSRIDDMTWLLNSGQVQGLSWRVCDASGAVLPQGAWMAILPNVQQGVRRVGLNELTVKSEHGQVPLSAWEYDVLWPVQKPELRVRVHATCRQHLPGTTPFTGDLGVRVTPQNYSVSSLQQYGRFPWQYFAERLLGAKEVRDNDDTWDAMETGTALHAILEDVLKNEIGDEVLPTCDEGLNALKARLEKRVLEIFKDTARDLLPGPVLETTAARWTVELQTWAGDRHRRAHNLPNQKLEPWQIPGRIMALEYEIAPYDNPFPLKLNDGTILPMVGQIDAVEQQVTQGVAAEPPAFMVVDFKTGSSQNQAEKDIATGTHLQLPLYALALQQKDQRHMISARLEGLKRGGKGSFSTITIPLADDARYASFDQAGATSGSASATAIASHYASLFMKMIQGGSFPLAPRTPLSRYAQTDYFRTIPAADDHQRLEQLPVLWKAPKKEKNAAKKGTAEPSGDTLATDKPKRENKAAKKEGK
jgi:RecB family exonuclease